ncbi:hypothetical protein CALVIDRAFT_532125, partial [Calocera viscosa TUFC12733]
MARTRAKKRKSYFGPTPGDLKRKAAARKRHTERALEEDGMNEGDRTGPLNWVLMDVFPQEDENAGIEASWEQDGVLFELMDPNSEVVYVRWAEAIQKPGMSAAYLNAKLGKMRGKRFLEDTIANREKKNKEVNKEYEVEAIHGHAWDQEMRCPVYAVTWVEETRDADLDARLNAGRFLTYARPVDNQNTEAGSVLQHTWRVFHDELERKCKRLLYDYWSDIDEEDYGLCDEHARRAMAFQHHQSFNAVLRDDRPSRDKYGTPAQTTASFCRVCHNTCPRNCMTTCIECGFPFCVDSSLAAGCAHLTLKEVKKLKGIKCLTCYFAAHEKPPYPFDGPPSKWDNKAPNKLPVLLLSLHWKDLGAGHSMSAMSGDSVRAHLGGLFVEDGRE